MINWKELEKYINTDTVITVVIMANGKEIFALSFNANTIAYKEVLESAKQIEEVKIPDKVIEKKQPAKKSTSKSTLVNIDPDPIDEEEEEEELEDDDNSVEPPEDADMIKRNAIGHPANDSSTKMTREQIMAQEEEKKPTLEQVKEFEDSKQPENLPGVKKEELKAPVQQQSFGEEW